MAGGDLKKSPPIFTKYGMKSGRHVPLREKAYGEAS